MMEHGSFPCMPQSALVHIVLVVLQSVTAVLVAWITHRAVIRDREERRRNGNAEGEK